MATGGPAGSRTIAGRTRTNETHVTFLCWRFRSKCPSCFIAKLAYLLIGAPEADMLQTHGVFIQALFAVVPGSVAFAESNPSVAFFHGKPVPRFGGRARPPALGRGRAGVGRSEPGRTRSLDLHAPAALACRLKVSQTSRRAK